MPPFLPRKRPTPPISSRPVPVKRARLADALDAEATNNVPSLRQTKTFSLGSDDSSSESSLSDIDSDQFEDIPVPVKQLATKDEDQEEEEEEEDDEDEEDGVVWEDADTTTTADQSLPHIPMANGPIQITLRNDDDDLIDYGTAEKAGSGKKGPSKREKQARIMTHQLHVQFLLLHNAIRNKWIGDKEVQDILAKQLPPPILKEVEKWKRASGLSSSEPHDKSKRKRKRHTRDEHERNQRDWGQPSQRLEAGKADMSHGDPIISLMKVLSAYWKKRFAITAPGLRKRGYGTKHVLRQDIVSLRKDKHDPERHGEKIEDVAALREIARTSKGSRDVGAQLFTALVRGLGIEARLIASLQPSGYGWTKAEQMLPRKPPKVQAGQDSSGEEEPPNSTSRGSAKQQPRSTLQASRKKSHVISLDTDDEKNPDSAQQHDDTEDDGSVVDVTPLMPKQQKPKYDRDLVFPIYWTEVISPITNKVIAVSPLVLETHVAATPDALSAFEPKGAKAEKGRQVMAYVVAYSDDSTAKDVTVRYLRKQMWPGKTKGFRLPLEKIPVYDKRGKIKRYEDYDWFKHILSPYTRSDANRRAVDDVEDSTDLIPQQPERKNDNDGVDTLQSLKSSADFVLERFLRREEALRPGAKSVRVFASGKGDKYREESVYRRADVERCLTAESWHKEGRRPLLGETPMKMVPVRAVTLTRKREAEEHERQYGEKQMQGLYSWDQTEWIIPPPIRDGVIPKNSYGNMDCFVPSMIPKGAVHVPLKGTVRICKKLDIDFAEAVTGFEFGNKRAVPVCTGVVIAKENERLVKDAWNQWNEEQRRKEETKMEKLVLDLWRKFVLGLRIRERVQDMYGEDTGVIPDEPTGYTREDAIAIDDDEVSGGGFVNDAEEEMGGGFLLPHEEEAEPMEDLVMDDHAKTSQRRDLEGGTTSASDLTEELDQSENDPGGASVLSGASSGDDTPATDEDLDQEGLDSETKPLRAQSRDSDEMVVRNRAESDARRNSSQKRSKLALRRDNDTSTAVFKNESDSTGSASSEQVSGPEEDNSLDEVYTPRPTRSRAIKGKSISKPRSVTKAKSISTSRAKKKPRPSPNKETKVNGKHARGTQKLDSSDDSSVGSVDEQNSSENGEPTATPANGSHRQNGRVSGRGANRSRGRVRGVGVGRDKRSKPKTRTKTEEKQGRLSSASSTRLLRKESTIVTSPYFDLDHDHNPNHCQEQEQEDCDESEDE